ncbi:synaptic vesicular amine transporter [Sitodiplosis mosellana]|uniref:synaptic vesicular amine transporter n=1 Tax=Sitodiplosis mosellana TaxID=263140 RepID=UPI0024451475|nr:synaptic vesicular amine transporter [Sitodiplosis mosellana]XP_055300364.1 synaptic vesicular amine transporter [Sitodiplosis mosellana]XP_055300365.1 synaptic vesicular amine transporter [Sitodiplosis mosellana]
MDVIKSFVAMFLSQGECSRKFLTFVVYMATLLDNILLTVIVPILPDYLSQIDRESFNSLQESLKYKNLYLHYVSTMFGKNAPVENVTMPENFQFDVVRDKLWNDNNLNKENGAVGILLATKALIQLVSTPIVKSMSNSFGYRIPTVIGTFILFLASLTFAMGQTYFLLLLARAMQGFASACISICGMSIIAQTYPEEKMRSQIIGMILGSMALGVLLGYPFGGILYAFSGKSAPFFIIAAATFIILALQLAYMDLHSCESELTTKDGNYIYLLADPIIAKIFIAILISTIAMATLEPCLPIWLMATLKPEKWQIGTVFIPDSIGYFISTNFLAVIAHQAGGMPTAIVALTVVGFSCLMIPHASSIASLVLPHFALGMGIGTLDVALVPLLASIVDTKYMYDDEVASETSFGSSYGGIYAIQQISVSMAYFLGPLLGGEISQYIGFSWLMSVIGLANICYGIYLMRTVLFAFQPEGYNDRESPEVNNKFFLRLWPSSTTLSSNSSYKRFYDAVDKPQQLDSK